MKLRLLLFALLAGYVPYGATECEPAVWYVETRLGSFNGGTRVVIKGNCFAKDQMNFGAGFEHLGNKVTFISDKRSYACDIHKDGCTEKQLMCYTRPMVDGVYYVRVSVDGVDIPLERLCGDGFAEHCTHRPHYWSTPTIREITPDSLHPQSVIDIYGRIITPLYGSNKRPEEGQRSEKIKRVWAGGKCSLTKPNTVDELYGVWLEPGSWFGHMLCKIEENLIANVNVSYMLEGVFGRSKPEKSMLKARGNGQVSHIQTHALIHGVQPASGGRLGGTEVEITGDYFEKGKTEAWIGGSPCEIQDVTDTLVTCLSGQEALTGSIFPGNRGIKLEWWTTDQLTNDLDENIALARSLDESSPGYHSEFLQTASFRNDTENYVSRMYGYFRAPVTGEYSFRLKADDRSRLYISTDHTKANLEQAAEVTSVAHEHGAPGTASRRYSMEKGKFYYLEHFHVQYPGWGMFTVGVIQYTTTIASGMAYEALSEIQRIEISSEYKPEIQNVVLNNFAPASGTNEVQRIVFAAEASRFQLGLFGAKTVFLEKTSSATAITKALKDIPSCNSDCKNGLTASKAGNQFDITFPVLLGDVGAVDVYPAEIATVTEITKGSSTFSHYQLQIGGAVTEPIAVDDTTDEIARKILGPYTVRCPATLNKPADASSFKLFRDYENDESNDVTDEVLPFCGQRTLMNELALYKWEEDDKISLSTYKTLCLAYRGPLAEKFDLKIRFKNKDNKYNDQDIWLDFTVDLPEDYDAERWNFLCKDLKEVIDDKVNGKDYRLLELKARKQEKTDDDLYVDNLYVGKGIMNGFTKDLWWMVDSIRALPAAEHRALDVTVEKSEPGPRKLKITIDHHPDTLEIPLLAIYNGENTASSSEAHTSIQADWISANIAVTREQAGTHPVTGKMVLNFEGSSFPAVDVDISAKDLEAVLETRADMGSMKVKRQGTSRNRKWTLEWLTVPGDLPMIEVDGSQLVGNGADISVLLLQNGGLFYSRGIPSEFLRTVHSKPQVEVHVNGIPSRCDGDCDFEWNDNYPTVTAISASTARDSVSVGTVITITGTGFDDSAMEENVVKIDDDGECVITAATTTSLTCTVGAAEAGEKEVDVYVTHLGRASIDAGATTTITYVASITDLQPRTAKLGGGEIIVIDGGGFRRDGTTVAVGAKNCLITETSSSQISCVAPQGTAAAVVDVIVTTNSEAVTSPHQLTYEVPTAVITGLSTTIGTVDGEKSLTISGTGFGAAPYRSGALMIGDTAMEIQSWTDTEVVTTLPPKPTGSYSIDLRISDTESADNSINNIQDIEYDFSISAISHRQGSLRGGLEIEFTGTGFPLDTDLYEVKFGETSSTVLSATADNVVVLMEPRNVVHIVDNSGSHPSLGKRFAWNPRTVTVHQGESVQWIWQAPDRMTNVGYRICQTEDTSSVECLEGGFNSGLKSARGGFSHRFDDVGEFHYFGDRPLWEAPMRGNVKVIAAVEQDEEITFKVNGVYATMDTNEAKRKKRSTTVCPELSTSCEVATGDELTFKFNPCDTPTFTGVQIDDLDAYYELTITGTGFGPETCQNSVSFGYGTDILPCSVQSSSETEIVCHLDPDVKLYIGVNYELSKALRVTITQRGEAQPDLGIQGYVFEPKLVDVSPLQGSIEGGAALTLTGLSLSDEVAIVQVTVGGTLCNLRTRTAAEIQCYTGARAAGSDDIILQVLDRTGKLYSLQHSDQFEYAFASTATIDSVTTTNLELGTVLTITGTGFGTDTTKVHVSFGEGTCDTSAVTDSSITCTVDNAVVGTYDLRVNIAPHGFASSSQQVTIPATIKSVSPNSGSTQGGLRVLVTGIGFVPDDLQVTIDSQVVTTEAETATQFYFTTPSHSADSVDIVVISNSEQYSATTFTYSDGATPTVTSLAKTASGISVTGTLFGSSTTDLLVKFCGEQCTVSSATNTLVQLDACFKCAPGEYDVVMNVPGKGLALVDASVASFLEDQAPTVTSFSPAEGGTGGGQTLTISGTNFDKEFVKVTLGDKDCAIDKASSETDTLVCTTPPMPDAQANVEVSVTVTMGTLDVVASSLYSFKPALDPVISDFSPKRGGTGGGTTITINGERFSITPGENVVKIDGNTCAVQTESATTITCITASSSRTIDTDIEITVGNIGRAINVGGLDVFSYIDVWSSPYTWGGEDPPGEGFLVVIKEGQTLMLDQDTPQLKMLLIQGGTVLFDDTKDVELKTENILITNGGHLQIGTEEKPHQHKAIITMYGQFRATEIPLFGAKTLGVRDGTLDLHGEPIQHPWTKLSRTAEAGDTTISLMHDVSDWNVGDEVVVATTGDRVSQGETEKRVITAISGDGTTLTLDEALNFKHLGVLRTYEGVELDMRAEVALLTRNVVFRGSSGQEWHDTIEACPDGFDPGEFATQTCFQGRFGEEVGSNEFGGQIMLHAARQNTDPEPLNLVKARLSYIEVTHAGQAFRLGRYPIHFHLNGNMEGTYVRGAAIHNTFNRAVNTHDSHGILLEHNVAYNVMGGAFFLEDGSERNNTWRYNLAIFVKASTSLLNDDITPASYWVTNPDNTIEHNVAVGGTHFGFWYRMHTHPDGPSFTDQVCPKKIQTKRFYNNTVHSMGWFGLWIFEDYFPTSDGACDSNNWEPAVFEKLTVWNCEKGAEWVNCGSIKFKDGLYFNNKLAHMEAKFIHPDRVERFSASGPAFEDNVLIGHVDELQESADFSTVRAMILPFGDGLMVTGNKVIDFDRDSGCAVGICIVDGTCMDYCGGFTAVFSGIEFIRTPNKGCFRDIYEGVFVDEDGSLSGTAGASIVPTYGAQPSTCQSAPDFSHGDVPASVCPPPIKFHRMALNKVVPESAFSKDLIQTTQYGTARSKYADKRATHKEGWMVLLLDKESAILNFDDVNPTNLSFYATVYSLQADDWVILKHGVAEPSRMEFRKDEPVEISAGSAAPTDDYTTWHYQNGMVEYVVKGREGGRDVSDRYLDLKVYTCQYANCNPPPEGEIEDRLVTPGSATMWTDAASWTDVTEGWGGFVSGGANVAPVDGEDVIITKDTWVVANTRLPRMKKLFIFGTLELQDSMDHVLEADWIYIFGGRLIVGWPEEGRHFTHNAEIILSGTEPLNVGAGPALGGKSLSVFGALDLHGKPSGRQWTNLLQTATKGSNKLKLAEEVEWVVGDEIMVTTTSLDPWQTEVFKITATDGSTLTLDGNLQYDHIVGEVTDARLSEFADNGMRIAAEVGLFTHNIKVRGAMGNNDYEGCRILVGTRGNDELSYRDEIKMTGFARIQNTEFSECGQYNYLDPSDPRYAVAFLDVGENTNSVFRNNSIRKGFNAAVGAFGMSEMTVENNVMFDNVGPGIHLQGKNMKVYNNLVAGMRFGGTSGFGGSIDEDDYRYPAGITVDQVKGSLDMKNNVVAGSERSGYVHPGLPCNDDPGWQNNLAHSTMFGSLQLDGQQQAGCTKITGIDVYKSARYGIYVQVSADILIEDCRIMDCAVGSYAFRIGKSPVTHNVGDETVRYKNVLFIGESGLFSCDDTLPMTDAVRIADQSLPWFSDKHVGLGWPSFTSGTSGSPEKRFANEMAYPTIGGWAFIEDVAFVNYGNLCGRKDSAISLNPACEDAAHPLDLSSLLFVNTAMGSRVFYVRPSLAMVNPSDCVDMICDATIVSLILDRDGSLLGREGAVISEAEFEYNGDRRYGVGDYRLPKYMQTAADGSRIEIDALVPNKGIYRPSCTYMESWQAYSCPDGEYGYIVFESMDEDTEMRRLSPIAVKVEDYVWLLNGPQDQGWCVGYTCQERVSTFYSIAAKGKTHEIYLASKPPKKMRFHHMKAAADEAIIVSLYYPEPQRIDVFAGGDYVDPDDSQTIDIATGVNGDNYFVWSEKQIYFLLKGSTYVDVEVADVIMLSMTLPAMSIDEFFGPNLANNLATLLGVPADKVRVMNVINESSAKRRKRAASFTTLLIEIGDAPQPNNTQNYSSTTSLTVIYDSLIESIQTAAISDALNITVLGTSITYDVGSNVTAATNTIRVPESLHQMNTRDTVVEMNPFAVQPVFRFKDYSDIYIDYVGTSNSPWQLTASLELGARSNVDAWLLGATTVNFVNGWANFTDLGVSHAGDDYTLVFTITQPDTTNFTAEMTGVRVAPRDLTMAYTSVPSYKTVNEVFNIQAEVRDTLTGLAARNLTWRSNPSRLGYAFTWQLTGRLFSPDRRTIILNPVFDTETGTITMQDLRVPQTGMYLLELDGVSTPETYTFSGDLQEIFVYSTNYAPPSIEATVIFGFKIHSDFAAVVGTKTREFAAKIWNEFALTSPEVVVDQMRVFEGSIAVTMAVSGMTKTVDQAVHAMWTNITQGAKLTFNGYDLVIDSASVTVNGEPYGVTDYTLYIIIGSAVAGTLLLVVVAGVIIYCVMKKKNSGGNRVQSTPPPPYSAHHDDVWSTAKWQSREWNTLPVTGTVTKQSTPTMIRVQPAAQDPEI